MRDENAKDNRQTTIWISHDLIRNNELAFSSRLILKNQTTEFGVDLEASENLSGEAGLLDCKKKNADRKPPITAN